MVAVMNEPSNQSTEPRGCPTPGACSAVDEIGRLRAIEFHAGLMRDTIESLSVGHAMKAETVRGALKLVVKAYDEGVA